MHSQTGRTETRLFNTDKLQKCLYLFRTALSTTETMQHTTRRDGIIINHWIQDVWKIVVTSFKVLSLNILQIWQKLENT
jgi:hypothetical protein